MKIDEYKTKWSERISIAPLSAYPTRFLIDVCIREDMDTKKFVPAEINWSAIGSVPVEQAEEFNKGLIHAIALAQGLNQKYGATTPTHSDFYHKVANT